MPIKTSQLFKLFTYSQGKLLWKVADRQYSRIGKESGYVNTMGYRCVQIDGTTHYVHSLIHQMHPRTDVEKETDHIDGNPANNCLYNLRAVSHAQNMRNRKLNSNNKSGAKGVSWHKNRQTWVVQIRGRYCGSNDSLELATLLASKARKELHGEFDRGEISCQ